MHVCGARPVSYLAGEKEGKAVLPATAEAASASAAVIEHCQ
jgi:hypothetical protein